MTTTSVRRQLAPVPFAQVTLDDPFWAPRQETNRTVTLPHMHQMLMETGRIPAFDLNFTRPVPSPIVQIFGDSDAAKWLEAACYALTAQADPSLAALVNEFANKVVAAQQPDGYLNTHFIVTQPEMRWKNLRDWHEMYCAGHLIEAAIAHHQATGDPKLLAALCRYADHFAAHFGREPGKRRGYDGHPEIELALVRLYHATGEQRYLQLAQYMVEERGQSPNYFDQEARERGEDPAQFWAKTYEYCQAHAPIRQQGKVVGHAVRAMYLLAGVADLAHELDDPTLLATCERLWDNLVHRRVYLTGGIGPSRRNEGFTSDYDLPDESAYAETCAAIALILWNHRLLQFAGDGKYADIIEQTLYNGFISGVSLEGRHFFYDNPLASAGDHHRVPWFACPCCPPNLGRLLASLGDYFYSTSVDGVWIHLYAQSSAKVQVQGQDVDVRQVTNYPWDGAIQLELRSAQPQAFTLHLRIPGWCDEWQVRVNGAPLAEEPALTKGYLAIHHTWEPGDQVELTLAMPVQSVWAHPAVRQMQGRLALQRGPIVYCMEGIDHGGVGLDRISLDPAAVERFTVEHRPDLLGGVTVLHGAGALIQEAGWEDALYRRNRPPTTQPVDVTAIPYCVWDNRAPGEMRVWFRTG
ncbi:MAG: glycoside hydrolase family 127 protein [Caldilineaceae bacterium]|nr:glycoside hydrolase family 127 protein [Caldilineaceae bacterium]